MSCVRLIAQKHRYLHQGSCANPLILENELKLMGFHSSAAGRVFFEKGDFDELTFNEEGRGEITAVYDLEEI